jgi:hypothetical protein
MNNLDIYSSESNSDTESSENDDNDKVDIFKRNIRSLEKRFKKILFYCNCKFNKINYINYDIIDTDDLNTLNIRYEEIKNKYNDFKQQCKCNICNSEAEYDTPTEDNF